MKPYSMQDKSIQWTDKVQFLRNNFDERELTVIGWKSNRIMIPVQTGESQKRESQTIEQFNR